MLGTSHYSARPKNNSTKHTEGIYGALFILIILLGGLASWGSYELWGRECSNDLRDYKIYTMAYIMVVYQWVVVGLCVILCAMPTLLAL
jgi:hypothetical protein